MMEPKKSMEIFNSRFNQKKRISKVEYSSFEMIHSEKQKLKNKKINESLCELWDIFKRKNLHITGVPKKEDREKGAESLFK